MRLKKEKEEKERKEEEEYQKVFAYLFIKAYFLKMKAAFAVEEEGFDEVEGEEAENLLKNFLDYVKNAKVFMICIIIYLLVFKLNSKIISGSEHRRAGCSIPSKIKPSC